MTIQILTGDALEVLRGLPAESVQCCVTSPPYYGLRDYRVEDAIGLEATPEAHIAALVAVFAEVRRVLRKDGVLWLNYGDAYASQPAGSYETAPADGGGYRTNKPFSTVGHGAKPKDLLMLPARVALALQADGWWLRSMLPWVKRSTMPESVTDRPATAIEYVFQFTRSGDTTFWQHRDGGATNAQPDPDYRWLDRKTDEETAVEPDGWRDIEIVVKGEKVKRWKRFNLWRGRDYFFDMEAVRQAGDVRSASRYKYAFSGTKGADDINDRRTVPEGMREFDGGRNFRNSDLFYASLAPPHGLISGPDGEPLALDVNPAGFSAAHFATFPPKLIEPLIKAATSEKGCCAKCGAPWVREVERQFKAQTDVSAERGIREAHQHDQSAGWPGSPRGTTDGKTLGWSPSCACGREAAPCLVLDPFGGAGTTGLVADRLGRDAILIELNPEYAGMARARLAKDGGLFAELAP